MAQVDAKPGNRTIVATPPATAAKVKAPAVTVVPAKANSGPTIVATPPATAAKNKTTIVILATKSRSDN